MKDLRNEIDMIDDEMQKLFIKRMDLVKKIALKKKDQGIAVLNQEREREILSRLTSKIDDKYLSGLYPKFVVSVIEISRIYQELIMKE